MCTLKKERAAGTSSENAGSGSEFAEKEAADLPSSRTAYVKTSATSGPALVLVHGFDSSALEFRRLLPELERRGVRCNLN